MDNVTTQIAHLIDEVSSRGVKHIRIKGFCGLEEIELTLAATPAQAGSSRVAAAW